MNKEPNKTLLAFTTAALSLMSLSSRSALAASADESTTISYRYSSYNEDALPAKSVGEGDENRYKIGIHQVRFKTAVSEVTEIAVDMTSESMSGASPWYIVPDLEGNPVQVMSGASIVEERTAVDAGLYTYSDTVRTHLAFNVSSENDYESYGVSASYAQSFNENNTEFEIGINAAQDYIEPSGVDDYPGRIAEASKTVGGISLGLTRVISRSSIINYAIAYSYHDGYLSDPYKQAFVAGNIVADARPSTRQQWTLSTLYRKNFENKNAALHLDYRYFGSDWETSSHTLELSWYQNMGDSWQISPQLRLYSQSQSAFYQNYYLQQRADGYYSSDYRLSAFNAASAQLKLSKFFGFGAFHISCESYRSKSAEDGDTAKLKANPALTSFVRFTAGVDLNF